MKERVSHVLSEVEFSTYAENSKISGIKIITGDSFDTFGMAVSNGLYDPRMGAQRDNLCQTCKQPELRCPGHFGHIDLSVPILNPMFTSNFIKICNSLCWTCKNVMLKKRELVKSAFIAYALDVGDEVLTEQFIDVEYDYETEVQIEQDEAVEEDTETAYNRLFWNILGKSNSSKGFKHMNVPLKKKHMILNVLNSAINRKSCPHCGSRAAKFRIEQSYKVTLYNTGESSRIITPLEMMNFCQKSKGVGTFILGILFDTVQVDFNLLRAICPPEDSKYEYNLPSTSNWHNNFFVKRLLIAPPMFRPVQELNGVKSEHPLTMAYRKIIEASDDIPKQKGIKQLAQQLVLQCLVNQVYDGNKEVSKVTISKEESGIDQKQVISLNSSLSSTNGVNKQLFPGLKQILEKKEGLLRSNCMGKRVNFAARSVISPDPFVKTTEIGIPPVFAKKLTFPERVTAHNILEMQRAVLNGPDSHPGAVSVKINKAEKHLASLSLEERKSIALMLAQDTSTKTVMRHIRDGDIVLMNRQPTLHKPSMMAHTVKVLQGEKTLRMHYANCNSYNADFDGDEMNMHFFQSQQARSEAYNIASNKHQYLVPTSGEPIRGLIQDHIVAGVRMCQKDSFFNKSDMCGYLGGVFNNQNARIKIETPAILKPCKLWTGKQIITTILKNISEKAVNGIAKGKIDDKLWTIRGNKNKGQQGKLASCSDSIAKLAQFETEESHVHVINSNLVTGMLDKKHIGASEGGLVHIVYKCLGADVVSHFFDALSRCLSKWLFSKSHSCRIEDLLLTDEFEGKRNVILQDQLLVAAEGIREFTGQLEPSYDQIDAALNATIHSDDKLAELDSLMKSVNNQLTSKLISTCLPNGLQKCFPENGFQLMTGTGAKGSNVNASQISCCLGQQELEGRRPPIMASGKSLPSFRSKEIHPRAGGFVSDRFLSGIRPQEYYYHCMAGREGLIDTAVKTARSGYLQRCLIKHLEGFSIAYDSTVRDSSDRNGAIIQFLYGEDGLDVVKSNGLTDFEFMQSNFLSLFDESNANVIKGLTLKNNVVKTMKKSIKKKHKHDPCTSIYNPSRYLGSVSERFYEKLQENSDDPNFKSFMQMQYMKSLAEPSESVGILAAQSIGEPSTQMTLNTFHFAGVGMKNVTLGIPRLREILMTASGNIKTPNMSVGIVASKSKKIDKFIKNLRKVFISDLITNITVKESYKTFSSDRVRCYDVSVDMLSKKEYKNLYNLKVQSVIDGIENKYIPVLLQLINKTLKSKVQELIEEQKIEQVQDISDNEMDVVQSNKPDENLQQDQVEYDDDDVADLELNVDDESGPVFREYEKIDVEALDTDDVRQRIIDKHDFVSDFSFADKGNNFKFSLMIHDDVITKALKSVSSFKLMPMLEKVAHKVVCRQVPGIVKAYKSKNVKQEDIVVIEGSNIKALWSFLDYININDIYTNDIVSVLNVYGVEAARQAIVTEISQVFDVYGISVDIRHLYLIADYMTREGGFQAFNRNGLSRHPSAMLKMSFETTCQVLQDAVLFNGSDDGKSPSSRLILGDVAGGGTGSFDIMVATE
eukprot:NODE_436_length_8630_cov_0.178877.p1 type:complete len:1558 gc:universal NODE_436_length_8630_cov_0.178877:7372-2699(-)